MKFKNVLAYIGLIGFLLLYGWIGGSESTYTRLAICEDFDGQIYTFIDSSGNIWRWEREPSDDFCIGCAYRLKMNTHHTDSDITDDVIINIEEN